MKIEIDNKEKKEKEIIYPCLMISDSGRIVFFTEPMKGVLLEDPSGVHKRYSTDEEWGMFHFKPFNGTIKLSND